MLAICAISTYVKKITTNVKSFLHNKNNKKCMFFVFLYMVVEQIA